MYRSWVVKSQNMTRLPPMAVCPRLRPRRRSKSGFAIGVLSRESDNCACCAVWSPSSWARIGSVTTARDFSVMPVQVDGEPKPVERAVRSSGQSFQKGSLCVVEFGATWATVGGRQVRVDGQWFRCEIVRHEGAIVHVRLLPDVRLSSPARTDVTAVACACDEGWVCEDHPDRPLNHDGCGGAGRKCDNPDCRWWGGGRLAPTMGDLERAVSVHERKPKSRPH